MVVVVILYLIGYEVDVIEGFVGGRTAEEQTVSLHGFDPSFDARPLIRDPVRRCVYIDGRK